MEFSINKDDYYDLTQNRITIRGYRKIDSIEDEEYYSILFSRYIEKKTFEVIATEMNYSYRNITRLHGRALKAFEEKFGAIYLKLS